MNAPGPTSKHASHCAATASMTVSRPYSLPPGLAVMRSTTSRCSITCRSLIASPNVSRWNSSGVEMLYGRLPTTRSERGPAASAPKSKRSASASCTTSRSGCATRLGSAAASSRSISTDVQPLELLAERSVSAPGPRPISTIVSAGAGAIAVDEPADDGGVVQEVLAEPLSARTRALTRARVRARTRARSRARRPRTGCPARARPVPASVERGAVVDGRAHDRQPERHVHDLAERQRLQHRQALVVIHRDDDVAALERLRRERRVGRDGARHVEPFRRERAHGRLDDR